MRVATSSLHLLVKCFARLSDLAVETNCLLQLLLRGCRQVLLGELGVHRVHNTGAISASEFGFPDAKQYVISLFTRSGELLLLLRALLLLGWRLDEILLLLARRETFSRLLQKLLRRF